MKPSHQRRTDSAAPHNAKPFVYAHAQDKHFSVLRLAPQYPSGPEYVACAGSNAVAHFFDEHQALEYCTWKNQSPPRPASPK
jgi:hypothetical protein